MAHSNNKKYQTKQEEKTRRNMNDQCKYLLMKELCGPTLDGKRLYTNACKEAQYENKCFGRYKKCIRFKTGDLTLKVSTLEDWESRR